MAKVYLSPINLEPSYDAAEPVSQLTVITSLSWYHANRTEKDAAKYLGTDPKFAKNHTTYAWATRMRTRGFIFSEKMEGTIAELKAAFDAEVSRKKPKVEVDSDGNIIMAAPTNVINLQERITAKTDVHIGELEGMIDEFGYGEKKFNAYEWFTKNEVKPIHASKIIEYFRGRAAKLLDELQTYPEYYEMPKSKIKSILTVMTSIVTDAERLAANVNKTHKPRKKKPVSVEKQVAKLKYLKKDDNFKIQSIDPANIVGAEQLWLFNVKTRKLGVYIAADRGGLKVKGSAIVNYEESSISKTLRKPEKTLTTILDGGKIALRKVMDSINSKAVPLNGRINKDTIILRAVR